MKKIINNIRVFDGEFPFAATYGVCVKGIEVDLTK